ncbi:reverse transcriptase domain-containing protein [Tanacetum coccineum]
MVKAVEERCVTCGGPHAYYNCPNTDNNQSSVYAATGTYNQVAPLNRVSNDMAPPGFAPNENKSANYVIREIHMRSCEMHIGVRSVVAKAKRQGYYWPTMHMDARSVTQKCDSFQVHAPVPRHPKTPMSLIMAPWPFYQWGMDILAPCLRPPEKSNSLL